MRGRTLQSACSGRREVRLGLPATRASTISASVHVAGCRLQPCRALPACTPSAREQPSEAAAAALRQAALDAPSPPFSMLRVIDLLPEDVRAAYLDTGAEAF